MIELIVVIAIIGLLASIVIVSVNLARTKARDTKRISEIETLFKAIVAYENDTDNWPHCDLNLSGVCSDCNGGTQFAEALSVLVTNGYISEIPRSPAPNTNPYCYFYVSNPDCNVSLNCYFNGDYIDACGRTSGEAKYSLLFGSESATFDLPRIGPYYCLLGPLL